MFNVCIREAPSFKDSLSVYKMTPDGQFGEKLFETINYPTIIQRIKKYLGLCNYANDILMDDAIVDLATYIVTRYNYMGVGIDNSDPAVTTLNALKSQVFDRVPVSTSLTTTYVTDDTANFIGVFTATSTENLYEAGIFLDLLESGSDIMLCRQTFGIYPVNIGDQFGIIWSVVCARG